MTATWLSFERRPSSVEGEPFVKLPAGMMTNPAGVAVQAPDAQTGVAPPQAVEPLHWPRASQVWGVLPLQRAAPGVQTPVQAPDAQT